ncbi:MAG: hypothetical protein H8D43_00105 [Chloroflexi bacterium]|nr:hypothetical protein [Chloroflexota bacterium]
MKKTYLKLIGIIVVFFVGMGVGAGGLWLIVQNNTELRYHLLERSTLNQPQAQIAEFVQAIVRGERSTALELWEVKNADTQSELTRRRESVISDLMNAGISPDYMVLRVEWWTTCCEPSVTCDSRNAGGARMMVQFLDKNGQPILYTFDIFTREQPYWGSAAGYPPREWVIREVYAYGQEPLFWTRIYESQVRYLQP